MVHSQLYVHGELQPVKLVILIILYFHNKSNKTKIELQVHRRSETANYGKEGLKMDKVV